MKVLLKYFLILFVGFSVFNNAFAINESKVPADKRSISGKYFTAKEAYAHVHKHSKSTLFIDVRDPAELFTAGMPTTADVNIPFKRIDTDKWDAKKKTFKLVNNPNFVKDVEAHMKAKGLSNKDTIIVMCGSGKRSAKAADTLTKAGFTNVYTIIDGYKGWQKSKLKWSNKLDINKMYVKPME